MAAPIIAEIVAQHAEDAPFLWLLRCHALSEPQYSLRKLAELDDRVEAHLDGLRVAGEPGWEIAKSQLGGPGEVFAAGVLAFESGDPAKIQQVLTAGSAKPESVRGLISALGWQPYDQASKHIKPLLAAADPVLKLPRHRRVGDPPPQPRACFDRGLRRLRSTPESPRFPRCRRARAD